MGADANSNLNIERALDAIARALLSNNLSLGRNPYKFSVYRTAAMNSAASAFTKINFDTKLYDTGVNFDATTNFRFTAPVTGYYHFNWSATSAAASTRWVSALFKNVSVEVGRGVDFAMAANPAGSVGSKDVFLTAGDTVEVQLFANAAIAVQPGLNFTYFEGFLISLA
jgi:hypothetical protein